MRGLTFQNPWPWFMLEFPSEWRKDVENRKRPIIPEAEWGKPIALHTSASMKPESWAFALETASKLGVPPELLPDPEKLVHGAIIGVFTVSSVIRPGGYTYGAQTHELVLAKKDRWHFRDQYGYVVTCQKLEKPIPFRGNQALWHVPAEIEAQIRNGV